MRTNFRHLYADIFWYGILAGSTLAFLAIYAARLGASGFQISLLTAGPAMVNLLFSLPAGRWLEGHPLVRISFWSAALFRLGYLVLVLLPWFFAETRQVQAIIWITLIFSVPGTVLAISYNALLADVIPADWRAEVVGKRNALLAISMTGATLGCGQLLDLIAFPLNYQIVFGLGGLGAILSTYHLGRLHLAANGSPKRVWQPTGDLARPGMGHFMDALRLPVSLRFLARSGGNPLLRLDLLRGPFGLFIAAYLLFYTFQYIPLPLFPLAYVNLLHLSDGQIGLGSAIFYGVMMLVSLRLRRISGRFGHHRVLSASALCFCVYPLLIGLSGGAGGYWLASFIGGGVYALLTASLINRLMEVAPEDERPAAMTLHNLALNIGILVGSLIGPLLTEWFGLRQTLLVSSGFRLLAGILLALWA